MPTFFSAQRGESPGRPGATAFFRQAPQQVGMTESRSKSGENKWKTAKTVGKGHFSGYFAFFFLFFHHILHIHEDILGIRVPKICADTWLETGGCIR